MGCCWHIVETMWGRCGQTAYSRDPLLKRYGRRGTLWDAVGTLWGHCGDTVGMLWGRCGDTVGMLWALSD
jgi:hypothetical protein